MAFANGYRVARICSGHCFRLFRRPAGCPLQRAPHEHEGIQGNEQGHRQVFSRLRSYQNPECTRFTWTHQYFTIQLAVRNIRGLFFRANPSPFRRRQYTWRTGTQDSPPGTGGDDERQRVGVVDQIQLRIFIRDLIYHPGLRPPLLFQEGSLASPSVKYIDAPSGEGFGHTLRT